MDDRVAKYNNNLPIKARIGRPNKVDVLRRAKQIAGMLLLAKSRSEIINFICTEYGVQEISCNNIISAAYKYLAETHQIDREATVVLHLQYYYEIYNNAKALGDNRAAILALNSIEKLIKLTLPETAIQNNSFNLDISKLDFNQLKELLALNKT
jgi:hypothetical protein